MLPTLRRVSSTVTDMVPKVVFVLGGPGAGKGTQCEFIVKVSQFKTPL